MMVMQDTRAVKFVSHRDLLPTQGRHSGVVAQCNAGATRTQEPSGMLLSRRSTLGVSALVAIQLSTNMMVAKADVVRDLAAQVLIPDVDLEEALVALLDARAVLLYVKNVSETPMDSEERRMSNRYLPGVAKRLQKIGPAAPTVAAAVLGTNREGTLSAAYGGVADGEANRGGAEPIFVAVGKVLNRSGGGIRPEALASPMLAQEAMDAISQLLDKVPAETVAMAEDLRQARKK